MSRKKELVSPLLVALVALFIAAVPDSLISANQQEIGVKNPLEGDAKEIKEGYSLFRYNCSLCHGSDARGGGKGPDLTQGRWVHGSTDSEIFQTITKGVPGTQMPPNDLSDDETWAVIAYLRTVTQGTSATAGDAEAGKQTFLGKAACAQCHMIDGKGGRLGPDLSRIGAARSRQYLTDSIREPSKNLAEESTDPNFAVPVVYDTATVVTNDGRRVSGVAKNEDAFSLQLMDQGEKLHFFSKRDVKEVIHEQKSLMPAYDASMLSDKDLQNLVAYLGGLTRRRDAAADQSSGKGQH
jgi:cytochrome c oxidase cbb3-type subunit III